eukprot:3471787-Prorocentrum_lima.AAC.1
MSLPLTGTLETSVGGTAQEFRRRKTSGSRSRKVKWSKCPSLPLCKILYTTQANLGLDHTGSS